VGDLPCEQLAPVGLHHGERWRPADVLLDILGKRQARGVTCFRTSAPRPRETTDRVRGAHGGERPLVSATAMPSTAPRQAMSRVHHYGRQTRKGNCLNSSCASGTPRRGARGRPGHASERRAVLLTTGQYVPSRSRAMCCASPGCHGAAHASVPRHSAEFDEPHSPSLGR
jgi:hypothetical protein